MIFVKNYASARQRRQILEISIFLTENVPTDQVSAKKALKSSVNDCILPPPLKNQNSAILGLFWEFSGAFWWDFKLKTDIVSTRA